MKVTIAKIRFNQAITAFKNIGDVKINNNQIIDVSDEKIVVEFNFDENSYYKEYTKSDIETNYNTLNFFFTSKLDYECKFIN